MTFDYTKCQMKKCFSINHIDKTTLYFIFNISHGVVGTALWFSVHAE